MMAYTLLLPVGKLFCIVIRPRLISSSAHASGVVGSLVHRIYSPATHQAPYSLQQLFCIPKIAFSRITDLASYSLSLDHSNVSSMGQTVACLLSTWSKTNASCCGGDRRELLVGRKMSSRTQHFLFYFSACWQAGRPGKPAACLASRYKHTSHSVFFKPYVLQSPSSCSSIQPLLANHLLCYQVTRSLRLLKRPSLPPTIVFKEYLSLTALTYPTRNHEVHLCSPGLGCHRHRHR